MTETNKSTEDLTNNEHLTDGHGEETSGSNGYGSNETLVRIF